MFTSKNPPLRPLLLVFAIVVSQIVSADWPQRRGPENNGISIETDWSHDWPVEGPAILWKAAVGTGFSSVTVADGRAYTKGNTNEQDSVFCLDAQTGAPVWTFSHAEPLNPKMYEGGPNSSPTIFGEQTLIASRSGKIFSLNSATGSLIWSNDLARVVNAKNGDWGIGGSPLVSGSRVFINYGSAMAALDLASGKEIWHSAKEAKGKYSFTTPVLVTISGETVLLAHMQKALFGLAPGDGRALWRHEFGSGYETHAADPVVTPAGIFLSSGDEGGEMLAVSAEKASRRWKNKNLGSFTGTAVLRGQHLYGVDSGGYKKGQQELRCVDVKNGELKWALPGFGQDSLIAAGDRLIVLTEKGELVIARANPEQGEILNRAQILGGKCWTQPTLAGGLLYCRNAKGQLVCVDLRKAAKKSAEL